ncbi:related to NADPH dehydrogenase 1 [Zygosaccharomyces bailii]|nr:related to NADPH dehydrogenase 1 [Zygosaccharomyces bailii]
MSLEHIVGPTNLNCTNLFSPIQVGSARLRHRVVVPPLSKVEALGYAPERRCIAGYYGQMTQIPGTLALVESTVFASPGQDGSEEEVPYLGPLDPSAEWAQLFGRIHANHSYVFVQLCNLGDPAEANALAAALNSVSLDGGDGGASFAMGPSKEFIRHFIEQYVELAKSAILTGADGVEIHHADGSLLNQFLDPETNKRTDEYGRSIENRARLTLDVVDAVIEAVGADRVAICFSPYAPGSHFLTVAQYAYILGELEKRSRLGSRLAYVRLEEPTSSFFSSRPIDDSCEGAIGFVYSIWKGPVVRAGNLAIHPEQVEIAIENSRTLITDGQFFISNLNIGQETSCYYQ